jgi:hypothetical protein
MFAMPRLFGLDAWHTCVLLLRRRIGIDLDCSHFVGGVIRQA